MKKIYLTIAILISILGTQAQVNADFEEANLTTMVPGTITVASPMGINGWTVNSGANSGVNPSCSLSGSYLSTPNACRVVGPGVSGLVDNIIGSGYKIWSVYGATNTIYFSATTANGFVCYGDWFVKLNDQTPGAGVQKMSKMIAVTPSNCLFEYAYISVAETGHCCCDGPGFALKLKINSGCTSSGSYTSCPQYSLAPSAGAGCSPTGTCASPGNSNTYFSAATPGWNYTKWKKGVMDLSPFVGMCVTVEVYAMDCQYGSHSGYVYFDAQLSPMNVIVNGNPYSALTPMINAGTCGASSTATITAPSVAGGYTWTCPGPFTVAPSSGGQSIYTSVAGNHTVTMIPPGSCSPIVKIINLIVSPAVNLVVSTPTQVSCVNPNNAINIQMASGTPNTTLMPNYYVNFLPAAPANTVGVSANTATYTGLVTGVNTITITDSIGCTNSATVNITPAPAVSSFSIDSSFGTVVGCSPNSVPLSAVNTNTALSNMTYTWTSSATAPATGSSINAISPGSSNTYTVFGSDITVGSCLTVQIITITSSTAVPTCSIIGASTKTLACNGACQTFTAITTGTSNITGSWSGANGNTIIGPALTPMVICANALGTYTANFCSTISGCCSSQTVAVSGNTIMPTLTVTPTTPNGYTINCTNPTVNMNVNSSATMAPVGYTWTPLANPTASTTPAAGGYTATVPGQYQVQFHDGNLCYVTTTVNIYIDTLRPSPLSTTDLSFNSYTLNCFKPTLVATAITNPMLPISNYSWTQPGPLTIASNTVLISLSSIPVGNSVNYTVSAMGANGCVGKQKVVFFKDIFVPLYSLVFTPSVITCANPCVALSPSSTSTVPVTFTISSPPPTQTATVSGALMCTPGPYTMTYMNQFNGCIGTASTVVPQNVIPPAVVPQAPVYIPCGSSTVAISAGTASTSPTYSYSWDGPPAAGMSCPGGTACATSAVNMPGIYNVYVVNTANGCSATNSVQVIAGSVLISVFGNNTICSGETTTLTASGATTYTWNTGANTSSIAATPTINTTYTVNGTTTSGSTTCVGQTTIDVTVNPCIGILEYEKELGLTIAPNPNTGKFLVIINLKQDAEILIFNSIGQEVFRQNVRNGKNEINMGTLAKGIYHFNITQNKQPLSRGKILIE